MAAAGLSGSDTSDSPAPCGGSGEGWSICSDPSDMVWLWAGPYSRQLGSVLGYGGCHVHDCLWVCQGSADPASETATGLVHHQQPFLCPVGGDHPDNGWPDGRDGPHGVPCSAEDYPVFLRGGGPLQAAPGFCARCGGLWCTDAGDIRFIYHSGTGTDGGTASGRLHQ